MRRVLIFTAKSTETKAVEQQLVGPIGKAKKIPHHVYETYHLKSELTRHQTVKDLEVALYETGRGQAQVIAAVRSVVADFDPDLVLYVGCAGGEIGELDINDVLIVTHAWPYEIGKERAKRFESRAHPLEPDGHLVDLAKSKGKRKDWRKRIQKQYLSPSSVKQGSVASGNKVLVSEEGKSWKLAKKINDEIVAVETDAYGFYKTMEDLHRPYLMIRGISDNLSNKNTSGRTVDDDRQTKATAHAAAFASQLLLEADYKSMRNIRGVTASATCTAFGEVSGTMAPKGAKN